MKMREQMEAKAAGKDVEEFDVDKVWKKFVFVLADFLILCK